MFRVGQKVVCVDADFDQSWDKDGALNRPVLNGIYTVRSTGIFTFSKMGEQPIIRLIEIKNPVTHWRLSGECEIGFGIYRFKPLEERETDISVFTAMLKTKKSKIKA